MTPHMYLRLTGLPGAAYTYKITPKKSKAGMRPALRIP